MVILIAKYLKEQAIITKDLISPRTTEEKGKMEGTSFITTPIRNTNIDSIIFTFIFL